MLDYGDYVTVDQGFVISSILPETEVTAEIAAVRIHVESAIGRIKHHILDGVIHLSITSVTDQIYTVCLYLINFMSPFVDEPE